jgi:hypothetical protein
MSMLLVRAKVDESRFFVDLALQENSRGDSQKFGYFVSALLSSFVSIFDRLRHRKIDVEKLYESHPNWHRLKCLRNNESHGVGGGSYVRPKISRLPTSKRQSRLAGRFGLDWDQGQYDNHVAREFILSCSQCLSEVEQYLNTL